ncbi:apoptosis facilitator Bcl-2-like protein 14 [Scleropages formosus]|nr:apoptosis facilitator Bcl-2-like protein 14 [Scleropages formosus]
MENGGGRCAVALEDSEEFQLLVNYASRRNIVRAPASKSIMFIKDKEEEKKKKKKKGKLKKIFTCVLSQTDTSDQPDGKSGRLESRCRKDVVDTLMRIVDSMHIAPSDIECDGEDDVIQTIVELLKESGDRLNEKMKNDKTLFQKLQNFNYAVFAEVTKLFVESAKPSRTSDSEKLECAEIALTFEVTRRLTAMQNHPMNLLMGFGARYLKEHFSTWAQQHGGWEKAFDIEDNDEVQ